MNKRNWISIDVESIGLYGDPFQVGWVVANQFGEELESGFMSCDIDNANGSEEDRNWVRQFVLPATKNEPVLFQSVKDLCNAFWDKWLNWKKVYNPFWVVADVPYPVESQFFALCVSLDKENRKWDGPYPLIDVASVLFSKGIDPTAHLERLENELPAHHPTNDARQSLRMLLSSLSK